ncbi:response regulator [Flavobacterium foetidum]|uniref:response regulator n=1 Tax=Flavobacterium foetidum TaxID=2026681 RepID=UPI0010752886|nr:response regulator [Flavobacterium foetidum]KAF2508311.1 response regulator [Flavobacterium foetidum]
MSIVTNSTQRRIYLADDDMDDRALFAEALSQVDPNAILTEAEDGIFLMDLLNNSDTLKPDIIFLDINMPRRNGMQCLEMIRSEESCHKKLPVIILSTSSDPNAVQKAFDLGASFYVVKPATYNEIKYFIDTVIKFDWFSYIPSFSAFRLM